MATNPEGLQLAGALLAPWIAGLTRVWQINIEYTPDWEVFQDQSKLAGVDCDVFIGFEQENCQPGILVIETKFVEPAFSCCGHCKPDARDPCPSDVRIGMDFSGCRYVYRNNFLYWRRCAEAHTLRLTLADALGCPFRGPLWQLWVNHTLAHALAIRFKATRAVYAVCAPAQNEQLRAQSTLEEFRALVTDPSSVLFLPLEKLLPQLLTLTEGRAEWHNWAAKLMQRYTVPTMIRTVPPVTLPAACERTVTPVTKGHRRVVTWMATSAFRDIVAAHRQACGQTMSVYFRSTDKGLVRIALHPKAPGYVGFSAADKDGTYLLRPEIPVPTVDQVKTHLCAFEKWIPTMKRRSREEQGVIPWLRAAIEGGLWLRSLGDGWVFLHQEWRWVSGEKCDVLAVHLPTGRLGIIEFKSTEAELGTARDQIAKYAGYWSDGAAELAPFFSQLLHAMGAAYGNEEMCKAKVELEPAQLFVGVASPQQSAHVWKC